MRSSSGDKEENTWLTICLLLCNHDTLCLARVIGEYTRGKTVVKYRSRRAEEDGKEGVGIGMVEDRSLEVHYHASLVYRRSMENASTDNVTLEPIYLSNGTITVFTHE